MGLAVLVFGAAAFVLWPVQDDEVLEHVHEEVVHAHAHSHGAHHQHAHDDQDAEDGHSHVHTHKRVRHAHTYFVDDHHPYWPTR